MWEYLLWLKLACFHETEAFSPPLVSHVKSCFYFFFVLILRLQNPEKSVNMQTHMVNSVWPGSFRMVFAAPILGNKKAGPAKWSQIKYDYTVGILHSLSDRVMYVTIWSWEYNAVITGKKTCVFSCTIYGQSCTSRYSLERGQLLLLEIYSTSPPSAATAELSASSSHPVSRRKWVRSKRGDLVFLRPLPWGELRFPE